MDEAKKRDYKAEYKKFQSSTKSKKYRAELNQYNRKKGTYGNGDGKDASHKRGKIVGFESQSKNRGRAEKSRLKKESINEREMSIKDAFKELVKDHGARKALDMIADVLSGGAFMSMDSRQIRAFKNKLLKKLMTESTLESINEGNPLELGKLRDAILMFKKKIEKQGMVKNARDEDHLERLIKIYNKMGGKKIKEGTTKMFPSAKVDAAVKLAKRMGGNMTGAVKRIEKMAKGLSKNGRVQYALRKANEGLGDKMAKKIKKHKGTKVKKEGVNEAINHPKVQQQAKQLSQVIKAVVTAAKKDDRKLARKLVGRIYDIYNDLDWTIQKDLRYKESVNEGISVSDERHFGKKGIIIMIDDNGKKVSAIFKDKKNADKFNRNKPSDIKKLLDLAKKTKYPKAIDESVNEAKEPPVIVDLRDIIKKKQNKVMKDPVSGKKMRVDGYTANAIVKVYDAINTSNKKKFTSQPLMKMAKIAFKFVK